MARITANNLSKSFGDQVILDKINFDLGGACKVGLVGRNGQGKSTLLKILASREESDGGSYTLSGRVGYLPQQEEDYPGTVKEYLQRNGAPEHMVKKALATVKIDEKYLGSKFSTLSGGEKTRTAIARLLLVEPEMLLLDEPTNHLDVSSLRWLEEFIASFSGTVLVISHDRHFLDKILDKIMELEKGCITEYTGNYSEYANLKKQQIEKQQQEYRDYMHERKRLEEAIRKKMQKAARVAKKKRPRDSFEVRARNDFFAAKAKKVAKNAKAIEKRLEMLEKKDKPEAAKNIYVRMEPEEPVRSGIIAEGKGLGISFDKRALFSEVDFQINSGQRIALLGNNGTGKTTLLRLILGAIEPEKGEIKISPTVQTGYLDQESRRLKLGKTILEEASTDCDNTMKEIRTVLGCLLFRKDEVYKDVCVLSMGERVRLTLAKLILSGCNFLIMDEPTNHLDIYSREAVERGLEMYRGTLLFVSHDRYFLEKMASEVWELEGGKLRRSPGGYREYMEGRGDNMPPATGGDLLLLETKLSQLSAKLSECADPETKDQLGKQFIQVAREINMLRKIRS